MKKLFRVLSVILVLTLAFPTLVLAGENIQQSSDLVGAEEKDFKNLIVEIQQFKEEHPEYSEEMIKDFLDEHHQTMKRGIADIWNALTETEKKLCIRYPFDALKVNKAKNIATSQTEAKFGTNGLGNRSDAFRHGIWNAEMTVLIGKERAELFATAHEDNKGVFVITFNAIWMLMETLCNYILITYCPQYAAVRQVGSFVSKIFFNAVILALKKVFTDDDIKELPVRYSILLVLIPTGSIYIMNNIFMLGFANNNGRTRINSTFTVLILLGMNILIFYVYMKLADDLRLRRMAAVYEQQLELCERHQQERELSMLQLRDIKHNMKNNLISILAYAENKEYEKMTGFIEEIMGEGGMVIASISNSGNIVIDSLIGYWYVTAQNKKIIFKTDICIPMIMPFKGADLSLILGNLLENAVEAAEKVEENRYINVKMKFDKNNLLLFVDNSYKGKLLKTRDNRLKSTKSDAENHGVGLASVYRAVAKYHGSVVIEDSEPGKFKIRIVLYSNVQE